MNKDTKQLLGTIGIISVLREK